MLDVALSFLAGELNTYLVSVTGSSVVQVQLSQIVDDSGKYAFSAGEVGTLAANVIGIDEERVLKSHTPDYTYINGKHVVREPDLKLNLHILFAANFKVYEESLKYLSYILTYFQANPSFNREDFPALDSRIQKLVMEVQSPTFDQLSQIWTFVGGKQLPSMLYKMRLVVIQPDAPTGVEVPITKITATLHNK